MAKQPFQFLYSFGKLQVSIILTSLFLVISESPVHSQVNLKWALNPSNTYPVAGTVSGNEILVDRSGNTIVAGNFSGTADFDPGPSIINLTASGYNDVFISRCDSSGKFIKAWQLNATMQYNSHTMALDGKGNFFICGHLTDTADFDPGPGVSVLTPTTYNDYFIAKYDTAGNYKFAFILSTINEIAISSDRLGNLLIAGSFSSTTDFDPSAAVVSLPFSGMNNDCFLAKYSPAGSLIFVENMAEGGSDTHTYALACDSANNIIVTGEFYGNVDFNPGPSTTLLMTDQFGASDIFLVKYNSTGNLVFASRCGAEWREYGSALALDTAGNIFLAGAFHDTVDFDPGPGVYNLIAFSKLGNFDMFFARYDPLGNFVLARHVGCPAGTFNVEPNDMEVGAGGEFFISGTFSGAADFDPGPGNYTLTPNGYYDLFHCKFDASGDLQFAAQAGGNYAMWNNIDAAYSMGMDSQGNYYLTGSFYGSSDFNPGPAADSLVSGLDNTNAFVAKYAGSGNFSWAIALGGYGDYKLNEQGNDIIFDSKGNTIICGTFVDEINFDPLGAGSNLQSAGGTDAFVAKYDTAGKLIFAQRFGGPGNDGATTLCLSNDRSIFILGTFRDSADFDPGGGISTQISNGKTDVFIVCLDSAGSFSFSRSFGGTGQDTVRSVCADNNKGIFLTGSYRDSMDADPDTSALMLTAAGQNDIFLSRLDSAGKLVFSNSFGSLWFDEGVSLDSDSGGNVLLAGEFSGTADFDPGAGTANLTSGAGVDVFIAKFDSSCNLIFAKHFNGSNGLNNAGAVKLNTKNNILITGAFHKTVDFDPGSGSNYQTAIGYRNTFFCILDSSGNLLSNHVLNATPPYYNSNIGVSIAPDVDGGFFVSGNFNGLIDLDPGPAIATIYSPNAWNKNGMYLANYDSAGGFVYGKIFEAYPPLLKGMAASQQGEVALTGGLIASIDFDPNGGDYKLKSSIAQDIFLARYAPGCSFHKIDSVNATLWVNEPGATYQWLDCGNNFASIPGATQSHFQPPSAGQFAVSVSIQGCIDTTNCITFLATGMQEELEEYKVRVFPNPANQFLTIDCEDAEISDIQIFNVLGVMVYEKHEQGNNILINIDLSPGIYFCRIHVSRLGDHSENYKIVKIIIN